MPAISQTLDAGNSYNTCGTDRKRVNYNHQLKIVVAHRKEVSIHMNGVERLVVLDKWEEIIHTAENSGMSIRPWCAANAVKVSKYYYWHRQLVLCGRIPGYVDRDTIGQVSSSKDATTGPVFAEIPLDTSKNLCGNGIEVLEENIKQTQILIERNQCKIFVGNDFSAPALEKVLEVIGHAS